MTLTDALALISTICTVAALFKVRDVQISVNGMKKAAEEAAHDKGKVEGRAEEKAEEAAPQLASRKNTIYERQ